MIQTKDDAQSKADRRTDRSMSKSKKFIPLMERNFNDLATLAEQIEWIKRKRRQIDNKAK